MSVCSPNYESDGNFPYRWCIVPECESSSVKTPGKLWIEAPTDLETRTIWLNLALRDPKKLPISKSQMYFCEDHFDLQNDMENYDEYKIMGSVIRARMKPNCVPTRFHCQADRIQTTTSHQQPQYLVYAPKNQPAPSITQTQMPILLTLLTKDNCQSCLPEEVTNTALLVTLFCVCCLARDVPFVRLVTCCHAEFLNGMIMPEIKPKNQVICHQCHNMLKKIKQFKLQVEESFKLLSDSSENIPKSSNQRLNHRTRQNFSMHIPDANRKKKPALYNATIPHTIRIKPNIRFDHIVNEEKIESKDKTEKRPTPISSEKKDKQTKNIKEALKIIHNNQNSECINLLASSLQTLSSTISDMMYPNFDLGTQFDTTSPAEMNISGNEALSSNITITSTENINEENESIADSTDIAVTPAISTDNITDVKEENEFEADSINIAANLAMSTENLANILGENAFETESNNTAINSSRPTENLNNKITEAFTNANIATESKNRGDSANMAKNPTTSTKNITNKKPKKETLSPYSMNDYINFTPVLPEGIGYIPINHTDNTNSTISIEELVNINKEVGSILGDDIDDRIICDTYGLSENVAGEELNQSVIEKEDSIDVDPPESQESVVGDESNVQEHSGGVVPSEKQESVGGGENNVQPVETPIGLDNRPSLGGNIKQLTLTREQLMEERAKTAASPAYLRTPHKCESCIIGFQFYENLEDHFKRKHTRGKRLDILCDVCRQFVDYGASYDLHTFWHHTRYQCVACEQVFASYDKAALHYRKQHSANKRHGHRVKKSALFKCPRCPYKTGRKRLLKEHMPECGTCKQCGVSIGTITDITLETHMIYCTAAPSEAKRAKLTPTSTETNVEEECAADFIKKEEF